ncbi:glycosyltransferase [Azospirillum brasilense]|nr:glycosyltransferase [Azospirillum brasilense]
MRIALLNTFDATGGAAIAAARLRSGLNRIGVHHAFLVARKDSGDAGVAVVRPESAEDRADWAEREAGVRAEEAPYPALCVPGFVPFHSDRAARARLLEQRLRRMRLDNAEVMNLHWVRGLVDWQTFFGHRSAGQALVWTLHDEHPFTGGCHYAGRCDRVETGCGACPVLGSDDADDLSARVVRRKRAALARFGGVLRLVAPSRWMAGRARSSAIFRDRPVQVIPNGVDTGLFHPRPADRRRHGIASTDLVVLFIAHRLDDPRKGYRHLCNAFDQLQPDRSVVLVTVGDGSVPAPRHVRTVQLGALSDQGALADAYALADVVVVPSEQDNQPNCCLEAMACGKAVLAFPTGGLPDMVAPGETGFLSADATSMSLAEALARCLTSRDTLFAIGHQARRRVLREFTLEIQAQRYLRLFEEAHREAVGTLASSASRPLMGKASP